MPKPRLSIVCALLAACGAGDTHLDPSDLELRDLLGLAPEVATAWDGDQRAAARHVIEAGLHATETAPIRATLGGDPAAQRDQRVAAALASIDARRAQRGAGALGLVHVAVGGADLVATTRAASLAVGVPAPVEIRLAGWDAEPVLESLPARGMDVVAAIATAAGHRGGPVVVTPAPRLAVAASYVPGNPARLAINPVILAALDPSAPIGVERPAPTTGTTPPVAPAAPPTGIAENGAGNPYSFYGSVAECAAAQRTRCDACLPNGSCSAITNSGNGNTECATLGADGGRGYFLICINLALAIDSVASCTSTAAPACSFDAGASNSLSTLDSNAKFLDDATCGSPLDGCLATLYGASGGDFPGPGADAGTSPPPRNTSMSCGDNDPNCDSNCELDGPDCDDSASCDGACSDGNDGSSCDGGDGGGGGGGCSDGEDSCGSENGGDCGGDSGGGGCGDCGGGGGGGDCGGGGGGDCGGGGGDCGGGGGDCGGGGGDCGGGGGDCNVAPKRGHGRSAGSMSIIWAFLPVPFAVMANRRARRRRLLAEDAADAGDDPDEDVVANEEVPS